MLAPLITKATKTTYTKNGVHYYCNPKKHTVAFSIDGDVVRYGVTQAAAGNKKSC